MQDSLWRPRPGPLRSAVMAAVQFEGFLEVMDKRLLPASPATQPVDAATGV